MTRIFLVLLTLAGCVPYKFALTADQPAPAKPAGCKFRIVNVPPERGYVEIGVVEYDRGYADNKVDAFKKRIELQVCQAGGDLVVAEVNGWGYYVRGIVLVKAGIEQARAE